MKRRQLHAHCSCEHGGRKAGSSGDRPVSKWAAGISAGTVVWVFFHHFGMWALAGAAATYLLVLVLLHAMIGGARR